MVRRRCGAPQAAAGAAWVHRPPRRVDVPFAELSGYLDRLESTSSRNELVKTLAELYAKSSPDEIQPLTYLIQGRLVPFFEPVEIGLGEKLVLAAIAQAFATPLDEVAKLFGPTSAKHLVRMALGRLRLGIGDPTVLDALSFAKTGDRSMRPVLEGAYNRVSDLGLIAKTFWSDGEGAV